MTRIRIIALLFTVSITAAAIFIVVSEYEAIAATKRCSSVPACHRALNWQRRDRAKLHKQLAHRYHESVDTAFRIAEIVYGMRASRARIIGQCESHLNPYAYNAQTASGVMQILRSTMSRTPFARMPIFDPFVNILAAGWIWRQDGGSFREWSCSEITGVR